MLIHTVQTTRTGQHMPYASLRRRLPRRTSSPRRTYLCLGDECRAGTQNFLFPLETPQIEPKTPNPYIRPKGENKTRVGRIPTSCSIIASVRSLPSPKPPPSNLRRNLAFLISTRSLRRINELSLLVRQTPTDVTP